MKTLVIYDSLYGNTKVIAQAIADAIPGAVDMIHVEAVTTPAISAADLLIVGGPTHGGGPSDVMKAMLADLDDAALAAKPVAAFDTRVTWWWLRPFGYAAPKIAKHLKKKGGKLVVDGEGFFVTGGKGPLREGEVERAAAWAGKVAALVEKTAVSAPAKVER
jgi:flavodoxin